MKIAIDIDDVMSSSLDAFIDFHNANYSEVLSREHFMHHDNYWGYYERAIASALGKSAVDSDVIERYERFENEVHLTGQIITPEVKSRLTTLTETHSLEVVTARCKESVEATIGWLSVQLPYMFDGIHFIRALGEDVTKADVCQKIGAKFLIDDSLEHCNLAASIGVTALLFGEYGWNLHGERHPDVVRVANWQDVTEYFNNYA